MPDSSFRPGRQSAYPQRRPRSSRLRLSGSSLTLGANRQRCLEALRRSGLYAERIAARRREEERLTKLAEEREHSRLLAVQEAERLVFEERRWRLEAEPNTAREREAIGVAAFRESARRFDQDRRERELADLERERREFVLLLSEHIRSAGMTDQQKEADLWAEEIASWLTVPEESR